MRRLKNSGKKRSASKLPLQRPLSSSAPPPAPPPLRGSFENEDVPLIEVAEKSKELIFIDGVDNLPAKYNATQVQNIVIQMIEKYDLKLLEQIDLVSEQAFLQKKIQRRINFCIICFVLMQAIAYICTTVLLRKD